MAERIGQRAERMAQRAKRKGQSAGRIGQSVLCPGVEDAMRYALCAMPAKRSFA